MFSQMLSANRVTYTPRQRSSSVTPMITPTATDARTTEMLAAAMRGRNAPEISALDTRVRILSGNLFAGRYHDTRLDANN